MDSGSHDMPDRVETICPCCNTRLTVDVETGEILSEERPKQDHSKTFDQALSDVQGSSKRREDAFSKAFEKRHVLPLAACPPGMV